MDQQLPANSTDQPPTANAGIVPGPDEALEPAVQRTDLPLAASIAVPRFEPEFQMLDRRFIDVERVAGWIFIGVLAGLGAGGLVVLLVINWPTKIVVGLAALAYLLGLVMLVWANQLLPELSYRNAAWRLDAQGLDLRRGIWWRHEITIPLARVQHTDVHQGPLLRKFGLAKLVIHTAGTQDASISMDGLSLETAHQLRDALVAQCEVKLGS